jgi:hypothetical protein
MVTIASRWLLLGSFFALGVFQLSRAAWAGQPPSISSATTANGVIGVAFTPYTITASNGKTPYTFSVTGSLPAGLTFDGTSVISGTPTQVETQTVTLRVTDANAATATASLTITITAGGGPTSFRFLTTTMQRATRSSAYSQTLLVANAAGEVTFAIESGQAAMTALGLTLNPTTGLISGIIPSGAGNASGDAVSFSAFDGTTKIVLNTLIATTSAGGSDFGFLTATLPAGEMEAAYSATVQVQGGSSTASGLQFIRFGAADLPPGLSMNGFTGTISGTPTGAGTFYVTVTATDQVDNNKALVVLSLLVLPKNSSFKFDTVVLDNGEVGVAYEYPVLTSGVSGGGGLTYSASGLPPGLDINTDTGLISGTPTTAGTFLVVITAAKGNDNISINRPLWIVRNGSSFYWFFSGGIPTAFANQSYSPSSPPVTLVAHPFTNGIVYSATGLPAGMSYDPATGALTGTPTEPGIYPVTFTATDSATGEQITFSLDFAVLPPDGGDTNSLPINLWAKKATFKRGTPTKDAWAGQWIYNADRRRKTSPPHLYDTGTDPLVISLGSIPELNIPRASLVGASPKFGFKGSNPAAAVKLDESAQILSLAEKGLTISDRYKTTLRNTVKLGTKTYRLDLYFDDKGKFTPALGYRKTAFVVASAKLTAKAAGKDAVAFSMLLGDPAFTPPSDPNDKTVRFRATNSSGTLIIDKDFTAITTVTSTTDKATGAKVYKLKSGKDATAPIGKFAYDSKSGKLTVALKGLDLASKLPVGDSAEEQLSVAVQISNKQYFTGITIFAPKAGAYSTKMPK